MTENIIQIQNVSDDPINNNDNRLNDNGIFDDVWDTDSRFGTTSIATNSNIVIKDWDDILHVYEPTHTEIIEPTAIKTEPDNVVKKKLSTQSKLKSKSKSKPKIQLQSKNKKVVTRTYDSEEEDDDYDDTYDAYY